MTLKYFSHPSSQNDCGNMIKMDVPLLVNMAERALPSNTHNPLSTLYSPFHSRRKSGFCVPLLPKDPLELISVPLHLNRQRVFLESHLLQPAFAQLFLGLHLLLRVFLFLLAPFSISNLLVALGPQGILRKQAEGQGRGEGAMKVQKKEIAPPITDSSLLPEAPWISLAASYCQKKK